MGISKVQFVFLTLAFVSFLSQASCNPIDTDSSWWDTLFGGGDSSSADATATNKVDSGKVKDKGLSAGLSTAGANSFAIDKNLHVPDPLGKTGGLDANFDLAAADSFSLSKGVNKKTKLTPIDPDDPHIPPYLGSPPRIITPIYTQPPPPVLPPYEPVPRPVRYHPNDYYQHEGGYNNYGNNYRGHY